jgi:hypothetical protein
MYERFSKKNPEDKRYSLCWVPHTFNDDQKAARVEIATSMLSILEPLIRHADS